MLVISGGAWSGQLLGDLGIELCVLRKPLYWWREQPGAYEPNDGATCFLYEIPEGIFYGFPRIDNSGVKVAEHTGGQTVDDPLQVDRTNHLDEENRVRTFLKQYLPGLTGEPTKYTVCLYTMTRDGHFIVDRHPEHPQVAFAAGLSGHGFKFASALGEILCQLIVDGQSTYPIEFLSCQRPALRRQHATSD